MKGIYLDNAATTPPFKSVLKAIEQLAPWYSSVLTIYIIVAIVHHGAGLP